ncbi:cytochrome c oxidase assembly protein [Gordonia oryzae]|uniref:Cytochrome c oxidase assembly protein n=1 Tax=Gordonia oryzae TaxID=2487349 RepID=A0A3N4GDG5_9ACTN|nr:cytochrome c oxidase assembly protein [Gordonia oryzae]RPA59928.1 cytochrome c oxidase assembly protein [Gordonia oryzae]
MADDLAPLTLQTVVSSWRVDVPTSVVVVLITVAYVVAMRRSTLPRRRAVPFLFGVAGWLISACGFVGVYSDTLFWVRALQIVLVLMVVPFCLALGMPVTLARESWPAARRVIDRCLRMRAARVIASPAVTSAGVIVTPWLIYLTGWYPALLRSDALDTVTRLLLVFCGFGYFYARLQVDPVPRRYPQSLSLLVTLGETLGDGILGVVMWQGGLLAASYYEALHRTWGPSLRTDQTIGAGVFWVLGDVIGLPFLLVLFDRFRTDEGRRAEIVDAELDADERESTRSTAAKTEVDQPSRLWWENNPELRERFR